MSALSFAALNSLTRGQIGGHDVACPACSHLYNAKKKVLRVWCYDDAFLRYHCVRCGEKGWAKPDQASAAGPRLSPEQIAAFRLDAEKRRADFEARQLAKARWMCRASTDLPGTLAET